MTNGASFSHANLKGVDMPHQDNLVLTLQVGNFKMKRVLINPRTGANITFLAALVMTQEVGRIFFKYK